MENGELTIENEYVYLMMNEQVIINNLSVLICPLSIPNNLY
jgi:hypothetical protein